MGHITASTGRTGHAKRHVHALWHVPGRAKRRPGYPPGWQDPPGRRPTAALRPTTAHAHCMRYDVSDYPDTSSGPPSMVHHPGTRPRTCSRPYDASRAWDASNMPDGVFAPYGASPDMPGQPPTTFRPSEITRTARFVSLRSRRLPARATTCLVIQTRHLNAFTTFHDPKGVSRPLDMALGPRLTSLWPA